MYVRANMVRRKYYSSAIAVGILTLAVLLLFLTSVSPERGYWTDAATFALNGEFLRDYIASGFSKSPMAFANAWFLHYPALTISLYPPIFPLAEAGMFALFGFSNVSAQATVGAFCALAAYGAYRTARTTMSTLEAAGTTLIFFAVPVVLWWSRQVMMEIPFVAFLLVGSISLLNYQANGRVGQLWLAVFMVLAAVYTKQTAIFAAPAFAAALLIEQGRDLIRRRSVWIAAGFGVIGLLPLAVFTIVFAGPMVDIALGVGFTASHAPSRLELAWLYARALPSMVGWLPLMASGAYVAITMVKGWKGISEKRLAILMFCWFVCDFVFISLTAHFETRYGVGLGVPVAVLSGLLIVRLLRQPWSAAVVLAIGVSLFGLSVIAHPIPRIDGNRAAAQYVLDHTKKGQMILLDLDNTKSFVLSLALQSKNPKLYVLRAEKLLVKYALAGTLSKTDRDFSDKQIEAMIDRYGVSLVVMQPGFWTNEPSMARLESILRDSGRFQKVAVFPITSVIKDKRTTLEVFVNRSPAQPTPQTIRELERHH